MKKLLAFMLLGVTLLSFACKVYLFKNLVLCGGKKLDATATFKDFHSCTLVSATIKTFKGVKGYKVSLADDKGKDYNCFFTSNEPTAVVKVCRD